MCLLQLGTWVESLRSELGGDLSGEEGGCLGEGLEGVERLLEQCAQHRDSSLDACATAIAHGEALLQDLR